MPDDGNKALKLMLVSGEPSGDQLGAQLMAALKKLSKNPIEFSGVGGPAMAAEGLVPLFSIDATSLMGVGDILPRLPEILRRMRVAVNFTLRSRPDALVCIDSPEFTHRIVQRVRRRDATITTVNYVAPQVWASRQYRTRKMARYFDLVLALLPFEVPFFETRGVHARFVGHPVVERAARMNEGRELRQRLGIQQGVPILVVVPGSRLGEVRTLLPVFRDAIAEVRRHVPDLVCLLPTVPHVSAAVHELASGWPSPIHILEDEADKFAAFGAADAALAASGTVTSELALAGVPMVVAYKLGWLSSLVARLIVRVPYVTVINLLLEREAVPEFLQDRCRADLIAPCLLRLFRDEDFRKQQQQDLRQAVHMLGADEEAPSLRAARALLEFVEERRKGGDQRSSSGR